MAGDKKPLPVIGTIAAVGTKIKATVVGLLPKVSAGSSSRSLRVYKREGGKRREGGTTFLPCLQAESVAKVVANGLMGMRRRHEITRSPTDPQRHSQSRPLPPSLSPSCTARGMHT